MKINLIAPTIGTSGYSSHGRGLANALNKIIDVRLTTNLVQGWEQLVNDEELKMIQKPDSFDRVNVIIDMPFNWSQHLIKEKNIGFLVFEGDKIPLSWVNRIKDKRVNQVWVPSSHTYNAIKNTLSGEPFTITQLMNKVKIIPHGFDETIFRPLNLPATATFLMNKGFRNELDRGGVQFGLRAFIEEFNKGEARLIVKLNSAYVMPPEAFVALINKYVKESSKLADKIPEITYTYDNLPPEKLNELYNSCSVLLNPTQAEAFSLPCIEAMACGKSVITTNFGGQTDYVTNENGWLIDGDLYEVEHELIYEGIKWMQPNLTQLKKVMRESLNIELRKIKEEHSLQTAQHWKWFNSALKAQEALNEL